MDVQDFIVNRDQHMRPLEYDLSENFNELVRYLNDMGVMDNVPVGVTSESEIVSISDAYPAPPRALNVYGKSTQASTPTPDAPVPIMSVDELTLVLAGKNLLDPSNIESGYITGNGDTPNAQQCRMSTKIPVIPGAMYVASYSNSTTYAAYYYANWNDSIRTAVSGNLSLGSPFTVPAGCNYVRLTFGTPIGTLQDAQLEIGSTATDYEPYVGTTVPDLLPDGTSLRSLPDGTNDALNLAYLRPSTREGWAWYSRELTQRTESYDLGDLDWVFRNEALYPHVFRTDLPDRDYAESTTMCSAYTLVSNISQISDGKCFASFSTTYFYIENDDFDTVAECKAGLDGVELVVKLATPVTTNLAPIELPELPAPNCTVWCDGGNATPTLVLEYVRDTNATIAELSEAIADIISG